MSLKSPLNSNQIQRLFSMTLIHFQGDIYDLAVPPSMF